MAETEIIALDFYDGAIEGFARCIASIGPCYFKLVAWDDSQDQRLFAAVGIDQSEFELALVQVRSSDRVSDSSVQVLGASVGDEKDVLYNVTRRFRDRLSHSGHLVLGPRVDAPDATLYPIAEALVGSVVEALSADHPEALHDWLPRIS